MFMLITKNTKYSEIMSFLNQTKIWADQMDNFNKLKKEYKYFEIDHEGRILIVQKGDEIIVNKTLLGRYHFNEIDYKRNFVTKIRKLKLNSIKD